MTTSPTTPTTMTWRRDGYDVWCDEDGVHLRIHPSVTGARGFEMPEAMALVELYSQVLAQYKAGAPFGKPVPPTREQHIHYPESYTARRVERVVTKAIRDEFSDLPF